MKNKKLLEVKDLTKIYKDGSSKVIALNKVNFDLNLGEELVIVGPSGSGKTTLLEIIAGLNKPTSGEVQIQGNNVHKGSDEEISGFRNKTIGFVFQMMHLQDYFSAVENVTLPLIACEANRKEAQEKAEELLEMVGLKDRMNHRPKQLSGGEMQRVAIARALINNPKIIMADEPTGTLDKENTKIVLDIFFDIAKRKNVSVIMITHNESVAKSFKNVIHLDHGEMVSK